MLTRRRFLITLPAAAALPRLALMGAEAQSFVNPLKKKAPVPPGPTFVYFATDTAKGVAKGIYLSRFDGAAGHLTSPVLVAETVRPSYLAISAPVGGHRRIYAANEGNAATDTLSSFLMDPATGALQLINKVSSAGPGPAYLSLDATGDSAFVADYAGGTVATYHVHRDGSLSEPVERYDFRDAKFGSRGPVAARQEGPHPHSVHLSPDNRFLLVNDLGSDSITVFPVDTVTARLGPPEVFTNARAGVGPRHIAFHPNGRWLYSINEIDSSIDHFLWTTTSSRTEPHGQLVNMGHFVKTIAADFPAAKNTAAEVMISPDGMFLYASNRGEDSLVVFSITPEDGTLVFLQRIACGGKTPRHFTFSADSEASWILCGNQDSATVTVFRRHTETGKLAGPVQSLALDSVMFTLFA